MLPELTRRRALRLLGAVNAVGLGSLTSSLGAAVPSTDGWIQLTKLLAEDGERGDEFGQSVALDGSTAFVGANGKAYVFSEGGGGWSQRAKLTPDDDPDDFGHSVALDGSTALVGARYDDDGDVVERQLADLGYRPDEHGAAYVFVRSDGDWTQQAKLLAADAASRDRFGNSVAVDGDTALVGADWADGPNGDHTGSAYVFTRSGGDWIQQAKLTAEGGDSKAFGWSVALDGDTAVVGARWTEPGGSAHVFARSGGDWTRVTEFTPPGGGCDDHFGASVAIDGDTAVVGAHHDEDAGGSETGTAYVFARSGGDWTQQAKLAAADGDAGDHFGSSVAIDGDTVLVGASFDEDPDGMRPQAGSAYVFTRSDGRWTQRTKLVADDGDGGDQFGTSVDLGDGTALVGAAGEDDPLGYAAGATYVYWKEQREVTVEIRPGSDTGPINPDANGVVPVGVVRPDGFDPAARIDVGSLRFGTPDVVDAGGGATPVHGGHVEAANGDGVEDLVVHFPTEETGFGDGDATGKLVGETTDGVAVFGTDTVRIAGGRGRERGNSP